MKTIYRKYDRKKKQDEARDQYKKSLRSPNDALILLNKSLHDSKHEQRNPKEVNNINQRKIGRIPEKMKNSS